MDRKLVTFVIAILALAGGIWLSVWLMNWSMGPTIEHDRSQYRVFMAKWPLPEIAGHFPESLPAEAADVRMILDPGGVQGAVRLELQMQLPQETVDDLLRKRGLLPATQSTAAPRLPVRPDPQAVRLVKITSPDNRPAPLPPDFRLAEFFSYSEDGSWAHGRLYGTAINPATRQVIHFAQAW